MDKPEIELAKKLKEIEESSSSIFPFEVNKQNILRLLAFSIEKKDGELTKRLIKLIHNFDDEITALMLSMIYLYISVCVSLYLSIYLVKLNWVCVCVCVCVYVCMTY
jgi:hypothetical protein